MTYKEPLTKDESRLYHDPEWYGYSAILSRIVDAHDYEKERANKAEAEVRRLQALKEPPEPGVGKDGE